MKKRLTKKSLKKAALCSILLIALVFLLKRYNEITIYDSLDVSMNDKSFEYGNSVNLKNVIADVNKKYSYSIVKDLDTSKVGKQQVEVKVEYKGIAKVVPIELDVVDSIAPVIELKEETITIEEGDSLSLQDNISNVSDSDKKLEYVESVEEGRTNYYTIQSNGFDVNKPGEYTINVVAVDESGNKAEANFKVVVNEVIVETPVYEAPRYYNNVVSDAAVNASGNDIVSIAYSYVGFPYVYGGNSPQTGFDCSGFVQYVYSRVGKSVSRSSYTQAYDGVGVSYENAQPGDILSWGHGGMVTHSAIYIGNGQMIHAMNSNSGVIISPVNGWTNADVLMAVRRVA